MKCVHCQGIIKQSTAPFTISRKGYHLILNAVSAWVCTQCGEAGFESSEVDFIQKILISVDTMVRTVFKITYFSIFSII